MCSHFAISPLSVSYEVSHSVHPSINCVCSNRSHLSPFNHHEKANIFRLEICNFSGYKIYPGHGKTFVRLDSRTFRLLNGKNEAHFLSKKNPRKFHWTVFFRKLHKKGINEEVAKKKAKKSIKVQRAVGGLSLEQIIAKKNQPSEAREAARKAAIEKAKSLKKEEQAKKKAEKAKTAATRAPVAAAQKIKPPKATKGAKPNSARR